MPIPLEPLPPGLEGQGYAAGAVPQLRPGLQTGYPQPVMGALRPANQTPLIAPGFSLMNLVASARDRFMSLFNPTQAPPAQPLLLAGDQRSANLERGLNDLERRSTTVKDMRLAHVLASTSNARQ